MNNPADNMYCMVSFQNKEPQILEIQGVVWFATEDLAYNYYMMLKPELRENDTVFPVKEEDLNIHFNTNSHYIKTMKTETRLTKLKGQPGVLVGQGSSFEEAINSNERLHNEIK